MVRRNREKKGGGVVALSTISAVQSPFHRLVNPNSDNLTIQNTQLAGSPRVNGRSPALPSTQQDGNVFGSPGGWREGTGEACLAARTDPGRSQGKAET